MKPDSKAKISIENSQDWIIVKSIQNIEAKKLFKVQLHDGEVEVMILGKELETKMLVIDDYIARKYAKYLGFTVTGTLGIILKSKERGVIRYIKPLIDDLVDNGIYIDEMLYQSILKIAKE